MILIDNTLYAGITQKTDLDCSTGYSIIRVTDGANLGKSYTLQDGEDPRLFIEVDDGYSANYFQRDNIIYAGITTNETADLLDQGIITYTGRKFIRIHDGADMGIKIALGMDYSYDPNHPRVDLPKYYLQVEDKEIEQQINEQID